MHMNAHQFQLITLNHLQRRRKVAIPDTVLAVLAAGIGFLAMPVTKTWVDAQPYTMPWRNLTQLFQHINRPGVYWNT